LRRATRTWSRPVIAALVLAACERDFSQPEWSGGKGGKGGSPGGEGGSAASEGARPAQGGNSGIAEAGGGSEAGATATGGDSAQGGAGSAGETSEAGRGAAAAGDGGDGGGGETNGPPNATFDFYYFRRATPNVNPGDDTSGAVSTAGAAGAPPDEPPSYSVPAGPGSLLSNDSAPDGADLTVESGTITTRRGGAATLAGDGGFDYTPPSERFWGDDSFEYLVSDGVLSSSAQVRVTLSDDEVRIDDLDSGDGNGRVIIGSDDREGLGSFVGSAGDVNGDGFDDLVVAAMPWNLSGPPGAVYVVFGRNETTPLELDDFERPEGGDRGFVITDFRFSRTAAGQPINGAGDLNGDGLDDVVISSLRSADDPEPSVYVVFGRRETTPLSLADLAPPGSVAEQASAPAAAAGFRIDQRVGVSERFGASVAGAGDVDGDGFDDLVIGASSARLDSNSEVGAAYVIFGRADLGEAPLSLQDVIEGLGNKPGFLVHGSRADARAGFSVAGAGDVNGDGLSDIAIGAPERSPDNWGSLPGAVYVIFGRPDRAPVDLGELDAGGEIGQAQGFVVRGGDVTSLGSAVSAAGYFDADALADIVASSPDASFPQNSVLSGGANVAFGRTDGHSEAVDQTHLPMAGYLVQGYESAYYLGHSVASGDFDGDGFSDVLLAGNEQGLRAYLAFGGGDLPSKNLLSLKDMCKPGKVAGVHALCLDQAGLLTLSPVAAGDFNGDGIDDAYIGAPGAYAGDGAGYVLFGWDIRNRVEAHHLFFSGGAGNDALPYSGGEILRFSGGHGVDTLKLEGPAITWDLRSIDPTRVESFEVIDLSDERDFVLILDDAHVRLLPSTAKDAPALLAKVLTVLGDAGDTLRIDLGSFELPEDFQGRRLFRSKGRYYGLVVDAPILVTDLP
jgi:hypothetical protein